MEGFMMNAEIAEEYFIRCLEQDAKTEAARTKILEDLVKEYKAVRLNEQDITRQLKTKKVLRIKKNGNDIS